MDTIEELFAAQVERRPDAVALACGDARLTYRVLASRAARLAARLRALGVGPGHRVALVIDRSLALAVATLAIIDTGAAFVALDPGAGADRLRVLTAAAGAALTVSRRSLRAVVGDGPRVMHVDDAEAGAPDDSRPGARGPAGAARPLYVIQTSGTTAAPRAVEVSHAATVDQVRSLAGDLGLGPADRHLHTAALGFTLAVRQLLLPLCVGGAVVIARDDELAHPLALLGAARRAGVTVLDLVPALLRRVVAALGPLPASERATLLPAELRLVMTAGERLPAELVQGWWSVAGTRARVINLYGASEVGGSVAWREVITDDLARASIPIGRARSGTTIELLDPSRRSRAPVADGEVGELWVAGRAADGPAWTRTGDLARRGADGALELVGRLDEQIKIRGVRVQPAAVEAVLGGVAGVTDVAVVSIDEPPRLVAYVVGAALPRDAALRERVRAELAAAFVPAMFVRVAELPRLASGKADRRGLRARAAAEGTAGAPPASKLEQLVARHWTAVLGVAPAGVADDFFALGGSSLAAFELAGRLGETLGGDVPAALAFDRPTLGAQSAWLAERPVTQIARPPLARVARTGGPLALSSAQERMWLGEQLARPAHAPRVHRALHLRGRLDDDRLEHAMRAVAERHEALRTTFAAAADGRPAQLVHPALPRDGETVDLRALGDDARAAELARLRAQAWHHAFDLARGPLWRTRLVRLDREAHVLLLTIHHLVTDGWSMRRWIEEVAAHYAAPPGADPAVPALRVQPADVADWQRRSLASGALDGARAYWREQLAGVAARPELPHDGPRVDPTGAWLAAELAAPVATALRGRASAAGSTLFAVLLAALAQLVAELTGDDDVVLGTLVAGRARPEVRPLIGLFLNTLPLRVRLDRAAGFEAAFASAREAVRGALAHAELPFERIVAEVQPPREARRNPLFDVVLNYLPPAPAGTLGALAVELLEPGPEVSAPFDLMWRVVERGRRVLLRVEYRRGRFTPARIQGWLDRYLVLLAGAA